MSLVPVSARFRQAGFLHLHDQQIEFLAHLQDIRVQKIPAVAIHHFEQFLSQGFNLLSRTVHRSHPNPFSTDVVSIIRTRACPLAIRLNIFHKYTINQIRIKCKG